MNRYFIIKRIFDVALSILLLLVLLPLMCIIAIIIRIDSKGSFLFVQKRLGLNGRIFNMYKFRTMCVGAENMGSGQYSFKGDKRVTKVGKILRATSLDELPQLLNILKGEMSFIGPRPTLTYHPWKIELYTEEQFKRFSVRPGITGLAQINGRKAIDWDVRIKYDVYYVENLSFLLDIKILFSTVINVILVKDNKNTHCTADNEKGAQRLDAEINVYNK